MIDYPAAFENYRIGRKRQIDTVVVHRSQGAAPWRWFADPEAGVSAHVSVADTGTSYRSVADENTAFHADNYNDQSLGIELTGYNEDPFDPRQIDAAAEIVADWVVKYGIPLSSIIPHSQIASDKWDPGSNFDWVDFRLRVQNKNKLGGDSVIPSAEDSNLLVLAAVGLTAILWMVLR